MKIVSLNSQEALILKQQLANIQNSIRKSAQQYNGIEPLLIGASKNQSIEKIAFFAEHGLLHFGENYVQEWQKKSEAIAKQYPLIAKKIKWHFIGHLQTNKVKDVVGKVEYIHTLDSLKLAKKIAETAEKIKVQQKVLCEINLAQESNKTGFAVQEFFQVAPELAQLRHLSVVGLMAIPPQQEDPEASRSYFKQLKTLLDEIRQSGLFKESFKELSMGMSQDYEIAITEGATMVRIGSSLFGSRSH